MSDKTAPMVCSKAELLKQFVAKAGCMHSQRRAGRLWGELRPLLTAGERASLMTAWSHHSHVRLGRGELDSVGGKIAEAWATAEIERLERFARDRTHLTR